MSAVGQCQYDLLCELGAHDPTEEPCRRGEPVVVVPVPVPVEPEPVEPEPALPRDVVAGPGEATLPLGPTDRL